MTIDADFPDAFRATTRKARKSHKCCECHREIKPGDEYQYVSGIWDHMPASFKTCLLCAVLRKECVDMVDDRYDAPEFEGLRGWCHDNDVPFTGEEVEP